MPSEESKSQEVIGALLAAAMLTAGQALLEAMVAGAGPEALRAAS